MPFVINIGAVKSNGVTQNGNVDIGPIVQNSHTANLKFVGVNMAWGDLSFTQSNMLNGLANMNFNDQSEIANPSLPIVNQA